IPELRVIPFDSREAAMQWVIDNQLARRNLTDERRAYYIGKEYLNKKRSNSLHFHGGNSCHQGDGRVSEDLAKKHKAGDSTVSNHAAFADAVDTIGANDPNAKEEILNGTSGKSRAEIINEISQSNGDRPTDEDGKRIPRHLLGVF